VTARAAARVLPGDSQSERGEPVFNRKLAVVVAASLAITLSGQTTALGAQKRHLPGKTVHHRVDAPTTTTTTLPPVPAAALPMLTQLVGVTRTIAREEQRAAALSEQYDQARIELAAADIRQARVDAEVKRSEKSFAAARVKLRDAAIEAYVTGQASSVDASLLSNDLSSQSMVNVYASIAAGHVSRALRAFARAAATAASLDASARGAARAKAHDVTALGSLRDLAIGLEQRASASLVHIKGELLSLVGTAEYARLMSPMPVGSPYKGPDLAGSALGKVGNALQGLDAVAHAKKLIGVPYAWGGASKSGVDCSGLVMLAWAAAGIVLEHSATVQWEESEPVPLTALQPGDLLFYHFADDGNTPITHVVMYVGAGPYGKATIIQAARAGTTVGYAAMYLAGFVSAGRP
jgi:cell wall-associated NlpC family hydrolase